MNLILLCLFIGIGVSECAKEKIYDGDILMSDTEVKKMRQQIKVTGGTSIKIWEGGVVPYELSTKFDKNTKKDFIRAMKEISSGTCIKFVPRKPRTKDYVFARPGKEGCSSHVGKIGGPQELLMSPDCQKYGTIVHELIHALGFYHEQSRPDRNKFVRIDEGNIITKERHNFDTFNNPFYRTYKIPYDYASIMHYGRFAFQKKDGVKTIIPKVKDAAIGLRYSMTYFDRLKINIMYGCKNNANK